MRSRRITNIKIFVALITAVAVLCTFTFSAHAVLPQPGIAFAKASKSSAIAVQSLAKHAAAKPTKFKNDYGVFIGVNPEKAKTFKNYKTVVIDAEYYSKSQVQALKKRGHVVYSYLNVGSIETFRSYYKKFAKYTLGKYENWPDERWVDVSQKKWQDYVVKTLAKNLTAKGIDGFFIDNLDVYYQYKNNKTYLGVKTILKGLQKYKKPLVVNGGNTWIEKAMLSSDYKLVSGVNQETVFSAIDFEKNIFKKQQPADTKYFTNYLAKCKKKNLKVYLLEYTKSSALKKTIQAYCKKNGFGYYISSTIDLV